jgi:hypothetical protein
MDRGGQQPQQPHSVIHHLDVPLLPSQCPANCAACRINDGACTQCAGGYAANARGKCVRCSNPRGRPVFVDAAGACRRCDLRHPGCLRCKPGTGTCLQCDAARGYSPSRGGCVRRRGALPTGG